MGVNNPGRTCTYSAKQITVSQSSLNLIQIWICCKMWSEITEREQACRDVILHDLWAGFRELVHVCVQRWNLEGMWHDVIKLKRWDLCFNLSLNLTLNKRGEINLISTSSYSRDHDKKVECHSIIEHLNVKRGDKLSDPGAATSHRNMTSAGRILLKLRGSVFKMCVCVCVFMRV